MAKQTFISIIVPFKNESERIEKTIHDIRGYVEKQPFSAEVILSDSYSTDNSLDIAKKYAGEIEYLRYTEPGVKAKGKGQAIADGIAASKGENVMFMDADSSTPITELDKLMPYIGNYDIVMGSRYVREPKEHFANYPRAVFLGLKGAFEVVVYGEAKDYVAKDKQGRLRQLLSRGGNLAFALLLNQSYADQRCGFKLYRAETAAFLTDLQRIYGFGFDTEFLAIAQKYKFTSIEVPVDWYDAAENSKVHPFRESINSFGDIFKIIINKSTGKYLRKGA